MRKPCVFMYKGFRSLKKQKKSVVSVGHSHILICNDVYGHLCLTDTAWSAHTSLKKIKDLELFYIPIRDTEKAAEICSAKLAHCSLLIMQHVIGWHDMHALQRSYEDTITVPAGTQLLFLYSAFCTHCCCIPIPSVYFLRNNLPSCVRVYVDDYTHGMWYGRWSLFPSRNKAWFT
jgi:hypothetical protein